MRTRTALMAWGAALCGALAVSGCSKEGASGGPPAGGGNTPGASQTGGNGGGTGGKKKIVFVFKSGGSTYSEACKRGAQQANDDAALNVEVDYQAPTEATAQGQIDIINQAVVAKADAIVVSPNDAAAVIPALKNAADNGVHVFTWDSDAPGSPREFYVAAVDDVQIGADILDALVKALPEPKGKVIVSSGGRSAENLNLHIQGVEEAAKNYPGIELVKPYIYNEEDKAKAAQMLVQALSRTPDAVGIVGMNSQSPPASGEALRKTGKAGKVKAWGLALPSETKTYLMDDSVTGLYLWDPQKLTYYTAKLVKQALDGTPPKDGDALDSEGKLTVKDGVVTLPLRLEITKANVGQFTF